MKVLFLDVDGCLNSDAYFRKNEKAMKFGFADAELLNHLDPEACARLQALLVASGAKIVLSSSWRHFVNAAEMQRLLYLRGVTAAEIIDVTPTRVHGAHVRLRGLEIGHWLVEADHHGQNIDSFVIVDDGSDMGELLPRLVQTDYMEGLQDEHVQLILDRFAVKP